ncbi:MAG: hypothetical protein LBT55_05380 [Clostridiaceae bacterium]|jgi:hypothetical protein|nr:hypothetical protein [Clostridiaceae bacterium]
MKKILTAALLLCSVFLLFGCNNNKVKDYKLTDNVSYSQTHLYQGTNENFVVEISLGSKETLFIADGKIGTVEPFSEISVRALRAESGDSVYGFNVISGETVISGEMEKNIFTGAYVSDIDLSGVKDGITSIEITADGVSKTVELANLLSGVLSWQDALNIAADEFKDRIKEAKTDGVLPREIYVKYVRDSRDPSSPYYWYVSFIGENNDIWAVLIDSGNGAILTKK